jgi:hypothetical protein
MEEGRIYFAHSFQSMVYWCHCVWACGEAQHHGRRVLWSRAAHLMAAGKQREPEGMPNANSFLPSSPFVLPWPHAYWRVPAMIKAGLPLS